MEIFDPFPPVTPPRLQLAPDLILVRSGTISAAWSMTQPGPSGAGNYLNPPYRNSTPLSSPHHQHTQYISTTHFFSYFSYTKTKKFIKMGLFDFFGNDSSGRDQV